MTDEPKTSEQPPAWVEYAYSLGADMIKAPTESAAVSEQPSGHLRWLQRHKVEVARLQQLYYITTYRGASVEQAEEWRDVPFASE